MIALSIGRPFKKVELQMAITFELKMMCPVPKFEPVLSAILQYIPYKLLYVFITGTYINGSKELT